MQLHKIKRKGRPLGSKNVNGYNLTPAAYDARINNPMKHGNDSKLFSEIIKRQELTGPEQEILIEEKINIWKRFNSPVLMLMDEYSQYKTLINSKLLKGEDPTGRDIRESLKFLLDISKEVNRLTQVSADKKADIFSKNVYGSDFEVEIDGNIAKSDKVQR